MGAVCADANKFKASCMTTEHLICGLTSNNVSHALKIYMYLVGRNSFCYAATRIFFRD